MRTLFSEKATMKTLALFVVCTSLWGQLAPYPGWASQLPKFPTSTSDLSFDDHPALSQVAPHFLGAIHRTVILRDFHSYRLLFHALHGELAIMRTDAASGYVPHGALSTGLQYVLAVQGHYNAAREMIGIVVAGVEPGGRSRILYSPWTAGQQVESVALAQMVPDTAVGARVLVADIVGAYLYTFDAVAASIHRYVDGPDSDAIPDAPDSSVFPLSMAFHNAPVYSFFAPDPNVAVINTRVPKVGRSWVIVEVNGALAIEELKPSAYPYVRIDQSSAGIVVGQRRIRVACQSLGKFVVLGGPSGTDPLSAPFAVASEEGIHEVVLSRPIAATDAVVIEGKSVETPATTVTSAPVTPNPAGLLVLVGGPDLWRSTEKLELAGANFSEDTFAIAFLDGVQMPVDVIYLDDSRILVGGLQLAPGKAVQRVELILEDPAFPGSPILYTTELLPKR